MVDPNSTEVLIVEFDRLEAQYVYNVMAAAAHSGDVEARTLALRVLDRLAEGVKLHRGEGL